MPASESHCPYDWFRKLRQSTPVAELQPGVFAITRDADVKAVLLDSKTFSARVGGNNPFALFGPSPVQDKIDDIMRIYPEEPVLMRTDSPANTVYVISSTVRSQPPKSTSSSRRFTTSWNR